MNVVLLNLYSGGHHGQHLVELVTEWPHWAHGNQLHVVVTDAMVERHPDVRTAVLSAPNAHLHLTDVRPPPGLLAADLLHGREALRWSKQLQADHVVFMYLDHAQISLSTLLRGGKTQYSGIHFRPSFHYREIGSPPHSAQERLSRWRKRLIVQAMLTNPSVHTLFELDEYAVPAIRRLRPRRDAAVHLPEPLSLFPNAAPSSLLDEVEDGRQALVLFGALDERKGLLITLDALAMLPEEEQERVALVLAGKLVNPSLLPHIHDVAQRTRVQLVFHDRFLDEDEIQPLLAGANLNLVPYVGHIGSSGILVRTATAGKPVLATSYGVVGEHVRRYGLGRTVDTWGPEALARALSEWLRNPDTVLWDAEGAAKFAAQNTAKAFAGTLFQRLGLTAS